MVGFGKGKRKESGSVPSGVPTFQQHGRPMDPNVDENDAETAVLSIDPGLAASPTVQAAEEPAPSDHDGDPQDGALPRPTEASAGDRPRRQRAAPEPPAPVQRGVASRRRRTVRPEDVKYPSDSRTPVAPYDHEKAELSPPVGNDESPSSPSEIPEQQVPPPAPPVRPSLGLRTAAPESMTPPIVGVQPTAHVSSSSDDPTPVEGTATAGQSQSDLRLPIPSAVERLVVGSEMTTFGKEPWWSVRDWTKLAPSGPPDDVVMRAGIVGNVAVMGCSARGTKHRPYGEHNDDSFTTSTVHHPDTGEPAFLVAVVCDGMGSAEYSSFSSRVLAEATAASLSYIALQLIGGGIEGVAEFFDDPAQGFLSDISQIVRDAVSQSRPNWLRDLPHIPPIDVNDRHLQSTLTFAVVKLSAVGQPSPALIGFIGDSPALTIDSGSIRNLIDAEVVNSGVHSTATEGAIGAVSITTLRHEVRPGSPLILATDGVANFLSHQGVNTLLGHYLADQWSRPIDQMSFIRDVNFDLPSADDDRTALVIWARDEQGAAG